jgi:hypothetical protein
MQMDLESYFEHERATADPEFWTRNNNANIKKLRLATTGTSFGSGQDYYHRARKKAAAAQAALAPANGASAVSTLERAENAP